MQVTLLVLPQCLSTCLSYGIELETLRVWRVRTLAWDIIKLIFVESYDLCKLHSIVMVYCRKYQYDLEFLLINQGGLNALLGSIKDQDPDKVSLGLASSLDTVAELELLQVTEQNQWQQKSFF